MSAMATTYTLSKAVHVEGAGPAGRFSFDFKAGKHVPKSEDEEQALIQAVEALGEPEPEE